MSSRHFVLNSDVLMIVPAPIDVLPIVFTDGWTVGTLAIIVGSWQSQDLYRGRLPGISLKWRALEAGPARRQWRGFQSCS